MTDYQYFTIKAQAKKYYWEGLSWFSLKTFPKGSARYCINQHEYWVLPHNYLLLNHLQAYSLEINAKKKVESFCLFFHPLMVGEMQHSFLNKTNTLLNYPFDFGSMSDLFFTCIHPMSTSLAYSLKLLRAQTFNSTLQEDVYMYQILEALFEVNTKTIHTLEKMTFLKASTRQEIYRRVSLAQDYIHANWNKKLRLKTIAQAAQLSTNHLLRSFKQIHHQTPGQYLTQLRISKAKDLLRHSNFTISEISFEVGFISLGSFSNLFKKKVGCSPLQFRKKGEIR